MELVIIGLLLLGLGLRALGVRGMRERDAMTNPKPIPLKDALEVLRNILEKSEADNKTISGGK